MRPSKIRRWVRGFKSTSWRSYRATRPTWIAHIKIGPLTDPAAHGGDAADAFHLVIPSLPGFGFSDKPTCTGWGVECIAAAWITLMQRLGYERYFAQGGDWGAAVTTAIGMLAPAEQASVASMKFYRDSDSGYIIYWNELSKGGHFAAFEQPELFVSELRDCFGKLRTR